MSDTSALSVNYHGRHWHYIYRHRRSRRFRRDLREILLGQGISLVGAMVAGITLELTKDELLAVAGVFLLLPGIFELGGAVAGAFGAKINHFHEQHPRLATKRFLPSLLYSLLLVVAASFVLGAVGGAIGTLLFRAEFWQLLRVTVLAATLSSIVGLPLVGLATIVAIRRGLDADNVIGPIETSLFDVLSIASAFIAVGIVL